MSKLVWDKSGERYYEYGVDHGVLYPMVEGAYQNGVVWNGLTNVSENPSGAESNPQYADNMKYLNLISAEDFGATIEAFTYPDEFGACDGSASIATGISIEGQKRQTFGLSYRTKIGNDEDEEIGYKIHLIYNGKAAPSEKSRDTVNESPEAVAFSWEVTTTPIVIEAVDPVTNKPFRPTAHLTIDSTKFNTQELKTKLKAIEDLLYGTDAEGNAAGTDATLPTPDYLIRLMNGTLNAN